MTKWTLDALAQWVQNDEGLYNWWRQEGGSLNTFVRTNRLEITDICNTILSGRNHTVNQTGVYK